LENKFWLFEYKDNISVSKIFNYYSILNYLI
jgi:hypothetical protein